MRVYVGTTLAALADLHATGELGPAPLAAHAVTPALREAYAEGDTDELEYVALTAAADDSLRLLAAAPADEARRRVVVAADVPDTDAQPDGRAPSAVRVTTPVPLRKVGSIHVDDVAAAPTVAAAATALPAADAGDDDAAFAVDEAHGWELMWFATQELPDLLT